jgi:hypothetical protein
MKTATGNTVRYPLAAFGTKVRSYESAVSAVGFNLVRDGITRQSTGKVIAGEVGLFRSDNGHCVGIHSPNFGFLQPHETLEILERARRIVGGEWASTAVLKGGAMLSASITLETAIVAPRRGDKLGLALNLSDWFNGAGKTILRLLANVLACDNGMVSQKALVQFAEKHCEGTLRTRVVAMEKRLVAAMHEQVAELQSTVTRLDAVDMSRAEVTEFANRLFPATDEAEVSTRIQNSRDAIVSGFYRGAGNQGRTRWDAMNSVTEFLDWSGTFRETEFSREENRFESIVSGAAAKTRSRALELLLN